MLILLFKNIMNIILFKYTKILLIARPILQKTITHHNLEAAICTGFGIQSGILHIYTVSMMELATLAKKSSSGQE